MADTVVFQSTTPSTPPDSTIIATDDAGAAGQVQIVKLAQSANGSATPVTVDADGVLVNLGANNDVTVAALPLPTLASHLRSGDVDSRRPHALPIDSRVEHPIARITPEGG